MSISILKILREKLNGKVQLFLFNLGERKKWEKDGRFKKGNESGREHCCFSNELWDEHEPQPLIIT